MQSIQSTVEPKTRLMLALHASIKGLSLHTFGIISTLYSLLGPKFSGGWSQIEQK